MPPARTSAIAANARPLPTPLPQPPADQAAPALPTVEPHQDAAIAPLPAVPEGAGTTGGAGREYGAANRDAGESVHAGTLNGLGALSLQATGIGVQSVLGRIAAAVHAAQGSRAPIQRTADRVSAVLVPVVLGIAVASFLIWLAAGAGPDAAVGRFVAVLVVACPCALGLATPTAILVASGRGAREGCLLRTADALQRLASVDAIALDKTGTLTHGVPQLERVAPVADGFDENEILRLAGAVERPSEQPLASAVVQAAEERGLTLPPVNHFQAEPGRGVHGEVEGRRSGSAAHGAIRAAAAASLMN